MGKYKLEYCEQLAKEHLLVRSVPNVSSKSFHLLLSVLVSECAWNPLATHVVCAGAGAKLQNCTLGILSGGHDKYVLRVLFLDGSDDSSGNHSLLPSFGQVEVEDAISSAIVYVRFHLRVAVLSADVHLSSNHADDVFVLVIRVQKRHSV